MQLKNKILIGAFSLIVGNTTGQVKDTTSQVKDTTGQVKDTTDLMNALEKEVAAGDSTNYAIATFKTTRLINGHTVQNVGKGVLDVKISHRFGTIGGAEGGAYNLYGLDKATMRFGFDYGINRFLMVGIGRSTYKKTYDAFVKLKLLRQSTGKRNMPITLSYIPTIAIKTFPKPPAGRKNYFSSKLSFTQQLIIGRKFSEGTSLQLMPTMVHNNLVEQIKDHNNIFAIGIGGRQKLSKRVSINLEYYYQLPAYKLGEIKDSAGTITRNASINSLSVGFDIETGGHVFQLHFTNSIAMNESGFIGETTDSWKKGEILFGFNISRVFTIGKKH
jgi:opacity protein-like surface antigen